MPATFLRLGITLGLISAIGPFAIDMYLPALPSIGRDLRANTDQVQLTLTVFFFATASAQLLYGPLSDRFGRKPPLIAGLSLFTAASIGCALAQSIEALLVLRFLQGLAAAGGMVIARAIVRDYYTGIEAARLMSLLMLVFSISPILAPIIGSGLILLGDWRSVFWAVALAGLLGLVLLHTLHESQRPAARTPPGSILRSALVAYRQLLGDHHYLGLVGISAFAMAGFFTYLASSSYVFIEHYGFSPQTYSLAFGLNAVAFFSASQFNARLGRRFGLNRVVLGATSACLLIMLILLTLASSGQLPAAALIAFYFCASACMGLVVPVTAVLALESHGSIAGSASALMGALQMLIGGLAMAIMAVFNDHTPLPMVIGMTCGVGLAWLQACITLRGKT